MSSKKNYAFFIVGIVTLIVAVLGATYAYFVAQGGGSSNTDVNVTSNTTDNLSFSIDKEININVNQDNFYEGAGNLSQDLNAKAMLTANNATNSATQNYYLYLDITENTFEYTSENNTPEIILEVTDPNGEKLTALNGYNFVTVGEVSGFDVTTANDIITIADNYEITSSNTPTTQEWNITLTVINLDSDQNNNTGKIFKAVASIQKDKVATSLADICESGNNLVGCIQELYSHDGANDLYLHDGTGNYINSLGEAGDNSIRYSGANPNNYVCLDSEVSPCPDDNIYRIIGFFQEDGNYFTKLIKYNSIGNIAWDTAGSNDWSKSTLNSYLNETFLNILDGSIIADRTWYLGANNTTNTTAKAFYNYEHSNNVQDGNATTSVGKVGLMYLSDYGYAADPECWNKSLNSYNTVARNKNWLILGSYQWTIAHSISQRLSAYAISGAGRLDNALSGNAYAVRPVFYLNSDITYVSGTGTSSDPYRIA